MTDLARCLEPDDFIERYGLASEPVPLPEVGTGGVFYQERYNVPLAGIFAILYAFVIFVVIRIDIKVNISIVSLSLTHQDQWY